MAQNSQEKTRKESYLGLLIILQPQVFDMLAESLKRSLVNLTDSVVVQMQSGELVYWP